MNLLNEKGARATFVEERATKRVLVLKHLCSKSRVSSFILSEERKKMKVSLVDALKVFISDMKFKEKSKSLSMLPKDIFLICESREDTYGKSK